MTDRPKQPNKSFVKQTEGEVREAKPAKKEIRRPLKPRDIKFIKAKVENPDITNYEAAMIATGATSEKVGSVQSVRMLENISLREALDAALVKAGFTLDAVVQPVKEALEYQDDAMVDPDTGERLNRSGRLTRDEVDMRLRAHDRAMKLLIIANGEPTETGKTVFNFNVNNGQQNFVKNENS